MKPYYKLRFENLELFQQYSLSIISNKDLTTPGLNYYQYVQKLQQHDSFKTCVKRYGLENLITGIGIYVQPPNHTAPIHTDISDKFSWSFNIPLLNYHNTYTNFFKPIGTGNKIASTNNSSIHYTIYNNHECQLIDTLELTSPHIINTQIPHNIVNPNLQSRTILTVRVSKFFDRNRH
jgi:hypothetical protein